MGLEAGRIAWVVCGEHPETIASYRYTAMIPAAALGGHVVRVEPGMDPEQLLDQWSPSALVLGKAFHEGFVALAQAAKSKGIPVIAAMCDWHFDNPINQALSRTADRIVVQTIAMAAGVREHFGVEPAIIEEPYEGRRGVARFSPGRPIRLLWYGHSVNLDTLAAGLAQVGALAEAELVIHVVTNRLDRVPPALAGLSRPAATMRLELRNWSLDIQWRELAACDAVLLPSHPAKDKLVKGHNRLVQAIHAGRLALAYPLPQYRELAAYCWCGEDLGAGLRWASANPAEVLARITEGQRYIDERFAPARIADRWRQVIEDLT
ncbi:MAG: glycosyltransferase family 4 protein [Alphaproteobacteria bacterium]|nr:glycosyltransferase family 4 protein [Alphaproteobacteria bacterium]